ncbi:MAG: sulfite exporter TauE/SafE family protein [Gammaproteobacteria bacterium]|nr:sulfite exporter TauE/SafE family protein [Gammaproteobacteria bacterium]
MLIIEIICFMSIGAFTGVAAGLLGIGGGLIIVPFSLIVFEMLAANGGTIIPYEHQAHIAIATSLATIIFTALSSIYSQQKKKAITWSLFWLLIPGILAGALGGAWLATYIPRAPLLVIFASFILMLSLKMWFGWSPHARRPFPGWLGMNFVGLMIGSISSLVGIGGGTMSVPFLNRGNISIQKAVAISSALGLPIAVSGSIGFLWSSYYGQALQFETQAMAQLFAGYIYLPAFIAIISLSMLTARLGVYWSHKLSKELLSKIFSILLFALAIKLYFSSELLSF